MANVTDAIKANHWSSLRLRGLMWHQAHVIEAGGSKSSGPVSSEGFSPAPAVYETRDQSCAAIKAGEGTRYYYSGFFGGRRQQVYGMLRAIARCR